MSQNILLLSFFSHLWNMRIVRRTGAVQNQMETGYGHGSSSPASALFHPHTQSSLMKSCWFCQLNISVLIQTSLSSSGLHILLNLSIFSLHLKYCRSQPTSLPVSGPFLFNPCIILLLICCFIFKHRDEISPTKSLAWHSVLHSALWSTLFVLVFFISFSERLRFSYMKLLFIPQTHHVLPRVCTFIHAVPCFWNDLLPFSMQQTPIQSLRPNSDIPSCLRPAIDPIGRVRYFFLCDSILPCLCTGAHCIATLVAVRVTLWWECSWACPACYGI